MSRLIMWEADYLLSCVLSGILLIIVYDILRILRIALPHGSVWTGIEDILYWLFASFAIFMALYRGNDGRIRWYAVAATGMTMFVFNFCISRFAVPIIGGILRVPADFTGRVLKRIGKRVKMKCKKLGKKRWFHGRNKVEKEKEQ